MIAPAFPPPLSYAVQLLDPTFPGRRLARLEQSAAAQSLLGRLAPKGAHASSKAHARAMAAAAVAPEGRIGIDVEYRAPGRPIEAIAEFLLGAPPSTTAAAYRAFTFHEAYFKAFGAAPSAELAIAEAHIEEPLWRPSSDLSVLHIAPAPNFVFSLVWTCAGSPINAS